MRECHRRTEAGNYGKIQTGKTILLEQTLGSRQSQSGRCWGAVRCGVEQDDRQHAIGREDGLSTTLGCGTVVGMPAKTSAGRENAEEANPAEAGYKHDAATRMPVGGPYHPPTAAACVSPVSATAGILQTFGHGHGHGEFRHTCIFSVAPCAPARVCRVHHLAGMRL